MLPTDQEGYEIALKNYLSREKPGASNLKIIEVQLGDYLEEDDIIRIDDEYNRAI